MKVINLDRDIPETWLLGPAVEAVKRGELIVFPTDSIYALGCDPLNVKAVNRLYTAKNMDASHRCSVICQDIKQASTMARAISNEAFHFLKNNLPGAYTVLLKASHDLPSKAIGKRKRIGVRIPDHPVPQALVEALGFPLLVTSLPIEDEFDLVDPVSISSGLMIRPSVVIDQGPLHVEPSTVIDYSVSPPEIIREGKGAIDWVDD